ncbi:cobalt transporter ATP-binding subunit [Porphyromonas cangingivalis]|nr:cobalt transporter ATP-binding subunit [Porphyromonas cangingivalis]
MNIQNTNRRVKEMKEKTRLTKVTISGYKSISSDIELSIELGDINVLLGANGSGKSNIISFFKMLNFMMSESFQSFVETAGTSQVFLNYGNKRRPIKGHLCFESQIDTDEYTFELTHATPDRLIIKSEEILYERRGAKKPLILPLESEFKESALTKKTDNKIIPVIRKILSDCRVYQFHDSSSESFLRRANKIETADYLYSEGGNLAPFLYRLKNEYPTHYERITGYIRYVVPQFRDFYLEPNNRGYVMLRWKDTSNNDYLFLPEQFSDGTMRFIALATLLLQPKDTIPNVIIIDEPELGLHPFAITQLAEMVKEASKHSQIIIATQAPRLVDEFEANQIIVVERDEKLNSTVANKLDQEDLSEWVKNYTLSELWDKNILGGRP